MTNLETAMATISQLLALGLTEGAGQMYSWHFEGMLTRGYPERAEALTAWYNAQTR